MLEAPRSLSVHDVRPVNRARLLWHLLQGPMTRRDLAESLDLSNSAVTNVLAGLVAEGLVDESFPAAADERRVGRPSAVVTLVPNSRLVIGLQIGKGSVSGVLCDLRAGYCPGSPGSSTRRPTRTPRSRLRPRSRGR